MSVGTPTEMVVAFGNDITPSFNGYRKLDTSYIALLCKIVTETGGLVIVYNIGEQNDKSGLRCYIKPVPILDKGLVLSKQAEQKGRINAIIEENNEHINRFLISVQEQIFSAGNNATVKINNTDIVGFFKKADILLEEPEIKKMNRIIFAYSDGIQSINGKDMPAQYQFRTSKKFTLCLSGWKTKLPCYTVETLKFEDPQGFLDYLKSKTKNN